MRGRQDEPLTLEMEMPADERQAGHTYRVTACRITSFEGDRESAPDGERTSGLQGNKVSRSPAESATGGAGDRAYMVTR